MLIAFGRHLLEKKYQKQGMDYHTIIIVTDLFTQWKYG